MKQEESRIRAQTEANSLLLEQRVLEKDFFYRLDDFFLVFDNFLIL